MPAVIPAESVFCAFEDQKCNCTGDIYYGAGDTFTYLENIDRKIDCGNWIFGDISPYLRKFCFCSMTPTNPPIIAEPTTSPSNLPSSRGIPIAPAAIPLGSVFCAFEGQQFSCSGSVYYGTGKIFVNQVVADQIECSNSNFGDPIAVQKVCFCLEENNSNIGGESLP